VVKAAANLGSDNCNAMRVLLDRRGKEVKTTEEILKETAENWFTEKKLALSLNNAALKSKSLKRRLKQLLGIHLWVTK
jgi:hypothetical protein